MNCINCQKEIFSKRKDAIYCSNKCGDIIRSMRWRRNGKEKDLRKTPKGKYHLHKTNAASRGIEFKLSFEEWWSVWEPFWSENIHGKLCMCRSKDIGAYEIGNVRIDTWRNNYREARGLPLLI